MFNIKPLQEVSQDLFDLAPMFHQRRENHSEDLFFYSDIGFNRTQIFFVFCLKLIKSAQLSQTDKMEQTKGPFLVILRRLGEAFSQPQRFCWVSQFEVTNRPAKLGFQILGLDPVTKFKPLLSIFVFVFPVEAACSVEATTEVSGCDFDPRQVEVKSDIVRVASFAPLLFRFLRFEALFKPKRWCVENVVMKGQGLCWRKQA